MAYIETPDPESASEEVAAMYESAGKHMGYLPNYARLFGHRPGLFGAWRALVGEVFTNLGVRNFELATLAAAKEMRSSYCSLAHGKILAEKVLDVDTVTTLAAGGQTDSLTEAERALMRFAASVAGDATRVEQSDIDELRRLGFDDTSIFDIASAAAARAFFSKILDALGAEPDSFYLGLDPGMREALTVGRPIETASAS